MTDEPGQPPIAPRPSRTRRYVLAATVIVVVALGATAFYLTTRTNTFTITGKVLLTASGATFNGVMCRGKGGYEDMRDGAQVTVTDAAGATIALGKLGGGLSGGSSCDFPFEVANVPSGHAFYGVTVGGRKGLQFNEVQARQPVTLALG